MKDLKSPKNSKRDYWVICFTISFTALFLKQPPPVLPPLHEKLAGIFHSASQMWHNKKRTEQTCNYNLLYFKTLQHR